MNATSRLLRMPGSLLDRTLPRPTRRQSASLEGVQQIPYRAVGEALEVIPRTLAQNCGTNVLRLMTQLRAKHTPGNEPTWGIDGEKGLLVDMKEHGIWEPYAVKVQTIKTAVEASSMLLRIDDIVSGMKKAKK